MLLRFLVLILLAVSICSCATSSKDKVSKMYSQPNSERSIEDYSASLKTETDPVKRFALMVYITDRYARIPLTNSGRVEAKKIATAVLDLAEKFKGWNYGDAIHKGNLVLGRVALLESHYESAKKYLILASKTPGSPQLNSFGPNMLLAQELLQLRAPGAQGAVLQYIENCEIFWQKDLQSNLAVWKKGIKNGWVPSFGGNLDY